VLVVLLMARRIAVTTSRLDKAVRIVSGVMATNQHQSVSQRIAFKLANRSRIPYWTTRGCGGLVSNAGEASAAQTSGPSELFDSPSGFVPSC